MPAILTIICVEHDHLAALASELRRAVARAAPPAPVALFYPRFHFDQALANYLKRENWALCSHREVRCRPDAAAAAAEISREGDALGRDFFAYGRSWPIASAVADWPRFCRETTRLLDDLDALQGRIETDIFSRVLGDGTAERAAA
ncbi:MAG: hypothetical protein QOI38_1357 [Sphingomonadales bacterium]|jgi:hypothetical protein|nr:hypothetical protein [Sphingomonadales bacterium]